MTAFIRFRPHPEIRDSAGRLACALSSRETDLLFLLMCRRRVSMDTIVETFWPNPDSQPDYWDNGARVVLCTLRKKLKPFGLSIAASGRRGSPGRWTLECSANSADAKKQREAA